MLEPQSTALFLTLMLAFAALVWWMLAARQVVFRVLAACLAFVPAMLFGVAAVNKYYDYYQTWGAVIADFTNQGTNQAPVLPSTADLTSQKFSKILGGLVNSTQAQQQGFTVPLAISGQRSHIRRTVLVYLPPQYFQKAYADYRFPVLELYTGYPGEPQDWINILGVNSTLTALVNAGLARPVVLVMPDTEGNRHRDLQCLNLPHGIQDATYLALDVPAVISRAVRVAPPGPAWGEAGYSEGGFCAANLALHYPRDYGYAGIMSGYFSPLAVLVGKRYTAPFPGRPALATANTPADELTLISGWQPIPQFWLGAGSADPQDIAAARAFQQLLLPRQPRVQLKLWRGGHNGDTWRGLLTPMLEWMTPRLAQAAAMTAHHPRNAHAVTACPTCLEGHGSVGAAPLHPSSPPAQ